VVVGYVSRSEVRLHQSQVLSWVLFGVVAYLVTTNLGLAAGLILIVPTLVGFTWTLVVMRRRYKRQFPNGRPRDG
jgi:hypothetical protein